VLCPARDLFFQALHLLAFAANGLAQFLLCLAKHFFGLAFNVFFVHGVSFALMTESAMPRNPNVRALQA
jgi:hypothetical protein